MQNKREALLGWNKRIKEEVGRESKEKSRKEAVPDWKLKMITKMLIMLENLNSRNEVHQEERAGRKVGKLG